MELHRRAVPDGSQFRLTIFKSEVRNAIMHISTQSTIDILKLITLSLLTISKVAASSWQDGAHPETDNVITFEYSGKPILVNGLGDIGQA